MAHASPLRCILGLGVWGVIALASVMVIVLATELIAETALLGLLFLVPGLLLAAIGGLGIWAMVDMLRLPGPVLTIGRNGIHDRRITDAPIPWSEITWRRVITSTKRASGDSVQFSATGTYPLRPPHHALAMANRLMGYPPLTLVTMGLTCSTQQIAEACMRYKHPMNQP